MRSVGLLILASLTGACSAPREAPPASVASVMEWAAIADSPKVALDGSAEILVQLQLTVVNGWHVYSLGQTEGGPVPMTVKVSEPYTIAGEIEGPPPVKAHDPNFGIDTETYSGEQIFRIPVKLAASVSVAPPPIELKVRSQACSDKLCLPAKTTTLTVTPEGST